MRGEDNRMESWGDWGEGDTGEQREGGMGRMQVQANQYPFSVFYTLLFGLIFYVLLQYFASEILGGTRDGR